MHTRLALTALATGALALAACSSSPSPAPSSTTSGTVIFAGSSTSLANNPVIPLRATGVITDTGTIKLSGGPGAGTGVIKLSHGHVNVMHSRGTGSAFHLSKATCTAGQNVHGTYTVTGGTGKYAHATGHGRFDVTFTVKFAMTGGQCTVTRHTQPASGHTTFLATGPLTIHS
jgi:hypothetical protein